MYNIDVYNTHIEISPYKIGDIPKLEKMCAVYIKAEYRYEPLGFYYDESSEILYIPRGISIPWLETNLNSKCKIHYEYDKFKKISHVELTGLPRDDIQKNAIDFLTTDGKFKINGENSQLILNLDTGDGKTFCAIAAICKMRKKALIITHTDTIRNQWIKSFLNHTDIAKEQMMVIEGTSAIDNIISGKSESADIYFISHATISFCANRRGWEYVKFLFEKLYIGIKIYDEAHLCFKNVIRTDMFSNTYLTIYLTATLGRSDESENRLYKKCFNNAFKFGVNSIDYNAHNKHIIYVPMLYESDMSDYDKCKTNTAYGFSFNRYLSLMMSNNSNRLKNMICYVLDIAMRINGRILITTSTVESIEWIYSFLKAILYDKDKVIGTYHSKNRVEDNLYTKENADIIISTIKGNGTGSDIRDLRCIINIESFSSPIIAKQLAGRLRPYEDGRECYIFDIVDTSLQSTLHQYKCRLKQMQIKCKDIRMMKVIVPYNPFIS